MRKIHFVFAQVLLIMLLAGMVNSAWAANAPGYISGVSVTASGQQNTSRTPANVIATSDFTESQIGMKNATLALNSNGMWGDAGNATQWIQFTLGSAPVNLDEMWLWGWNEAAAKQAYSWKDVIISYSDSDGSVPASGTNTPYPTVLGGTGKVWTLASPPCINGAPASNLAANDSASPPIAAGQPIYFGGVAARYVRISKVNNWGAAPATGTSGFQRVRFYTPAAEPYVSIGGNSVTAGTPLAFAMKTQFYNITSSPLTVSALSQFHPMELSTFTITQTPGTPIMLNPAPAAPKYQAGGITDSYNVIFAPQFKGTYLTTLTLNMTAPTGPDTVSNSKFTIPITAWAYSDDPTFIKGVTATDSSHQSTSRMAGKMVDGSGITEENNVLGSRNAVHAIGGGNNNFWLSDSSNVTTSAWVQFDLGAVYSVKNMVLWNNNDTSGTSTPSKTASDYSTYGIKTAKIFYKVASADAWTTLGGNLQTFTFPKGSGVVSIPASATVDFGDVSCRYVQIRPAGPKGVGSWTTSSEYVGISEVRFYKTNANPVGRWNSFE